MICRGILDLKQCLTYPNYYYFLQANVYNIMDYAQIPNFINMTISSGGNTKSYRLNDQEYNEYNNYKDHDTKSISKCIKNTLFILFYF